MAIGTQFTVSTAGDIRYSAGASTFTVLELHRWLQDLADDQQASTSSSDLLDITSSTPSERSTDQIISLVNGYNITDVEAEYFYGGSISQDSGNTLYSGLRVLGTVATTATQIQVIQDNALYDGDAPFWGDQSTPFNGGGSVLMRIMVKSRMSGFDIDGKRIRVRIGNYGDTFASFDVELGLAESVAALSSVSDPQNDTAAATVSAYSHVTNTEGYQLIDIGDGSGSQPYYSQWTYGADTAGDQLKSVWEWVKYQTRVGATGTLYGLDGDLFRGITHQIDFNTQSTNFQEDEYVVWGTDITYGDLTGGTFTRGNYAVVGSSGAAGKILDDNGTTNMILANEDVSIPPVATDAITEYYASNGSATGVTASVVSLINGGSEGGEGWVVAMDDNGASGSLWVQLTHGLIVEDTVPLAGVTSGGDGVASGAGVLQTIPAVHIGSFTGSLIGAYGIGIDSGDLTSSDTVQDLDGDTLTPPNNVTYTVDGLVIGEDYLLVGPKDAALSNFDFDILSLNTALHASNETSIVTTAAIPADTPASGTIRVQLDSGVYKRQSYTSYTGSTFTVASSNYDTDGGATAGNNIFPSYLDLLATATAESFITVYASARTLWQRARDGGTAGDGEPIVTWEAQGTLGANGGSAIVSRISDA